MEFETVMFSSNCIAVVKHIFSEMSIENINKLSKKLLLEMKEIQKKMYKSDRLEPNREIKVSVMSCDEETLIVSAALDFIGKIKRRKLQRILELDHLDDIWESKTIEWKEEL